MKYFIIIILTLAMCAPANCAQESVSFAKLIKIFKTKNSKKNAVSYPIPEGASCSPNKQEVSNCINKK